MTIASIFIINYYNNDAQSKRLGTSYLWVGDDPTPWSNSLTIATIEPINEGGFINLDRPIKGRYVVLRRDGPGISNNWYTVSEIRVYSVTNLLNYGATILSAPESTTSSKSAQNLVTNLRTRSARNNFNPIIDSSGNRATFETCLVTTDSQVGPEGDQFELAFDLGKPMMVNAILIA